MSRRISVPMGLLAAALLTCGLAGCGKMGRLERPGPMFGQTSAASAQHGEQQDPNRPVKTIDPRDPDPDPSQTPTPR